jgi:hypothetical protein
MLTYAGVDPQGGLELTRIVLLERLQAWTSEKLTYADVC